MPNDGGLGKYSSILASKVSSRLRSPLSPVFESECGTRQIVVFVEGEGGPI